jgi:hypothetical protein
MIMANSNKGAQVAVIENSTDKVVAKLLSDALVIAPPWVIGGAAVVVTEIFHVKWHGNTWSAVGLVPPSLLLTGLAWKFSHHRSTLNRWHVTLTTAAAGLWAAFATSFGPFHGQVMSYITVVGGLTVGLSWNLRRAIRSDGEGRGEDTLRELFGEQAETVGLAGSRMHTIKASAHKIAAKLHLMPGKQVAEDVQKKALYIESALKLPPGSVTATPDMDRADLVDVTVSDPRVMRNSLPWPGPSRAGKSIAEPIRPGLFQDLDEVELIIPGNHLQVMGMSGAGKSIGCAWNALGEIITRHDVAVFAIDLVKGEQTLGPLRPALHRFETGLDGAKDLLTSMAAELSTRTNYLASKGFTKWQEGCGLPYWVLWIEEAWKLFDLVDMDAFEELMKAIRSAGGTVVFSLQRSDHSQVPTIVRGQSSFWTFGVATSKDADFGLSEEQSDAGARPERWKTNYPGMSYIDAPSIPRDRIAMTVRTYDWDDDMAAMRAHAEQYPAAGKKVDPVTARLARLSAAAPVVAGQVEESEAVNGQQQDDEQEADVMSEYVTTGDPDPELTAQVGADDPIEDDEDDGEFLFGKPKRTTGKPSPEEAARALLDQIAAWAEDGRMTFATRDLRDVWEEVDRSRSWIIGEVKKLIAAGVIADAEGGGYTIVKAPELA